MAIILSFISNVYIRNIIVCIQVTTTAAPTTAAPSGGGGGCFPSSGKIMLENGTMVTMSDLQIGYKVQTGMNFLSHHQKI